MGHFSQGRERSYESCPNKYISFDLPLADAIDFGQVLVILKRTLQEPELPEIKIYGNRNDGYFLNSLSPRFRFSAVQNSSLGDLVTHSVSQSLTVFLLQFGFYNLLQFVQFLTNF